MVPKVGLVEAIVGLRFGEERQRNDFEEQAINFVKAETDDDVAECLGARTGTEPGAVTGSQEIGGETGIDPNQFFEFVGACVSASSRRRSNRGTI